MHVNSINGGVKRVLQRCVWHCCHARAGALKTLRWRKEAAHTQRGQRGQWSQTQGIQWHAIYKYNATSNALVKCRVHKNKHKCEVVIILCLWGDTNTWVSPEHKIWIFFCTFQSARAVTSGSDLQHCEQRFVFDWFASTFIHHEAKNVPPNNIPIISDGVRTVFWQCRRFHRGKLVWVGLSTS